MYILLLNIT